MNWAVKLSITERVVTVAERAAGARSDQRRRCAVIIDRDPEVVSGLEALLVPQFDVQSADSPLSAALLIDQLKHVDLAFVELELPDFAGEQLLQQLGRWPDAIRVLLTQKSLPDAGAGAVQSNAATSNAATSNAATSNAATSNAASLKGPAPTRALPAPALRPSALRASSFLTRDRLRNAYLAHLVLSKPISAQVVRALQRATLGLLRI